VVYDVRPFLRPFISRHHKTFSERSSSAGVIFIPVSLDFAHSSQDDRCASGRRGANRKRDWCKKRRNCTKTAQFEQDLAVAKIFAQAKSHKFSRGFWVSSKHKLESVKIFLWSFPISQKLFFVDL
jgi:hypothetical protein